MTDGTATIALELSYDGREFAGWQRHGKHATVQGAVEDALRDAFDLDARVHGAGRTDKGAHALGQVASVELPAELDVESLPERLNEVLPFGVAIERAARAPEGFHARHSALAKTYRYVLWNQDELPVEYERRVWHVHGDLDVDAMTEATRRFVGELDFASFATKSSDRRGDTVRTMFRSELHAEPPIVELTFTADGFLYKMVRNVVRAIVRVGEGRWTLRRMENVLAKCDRSAAPGSAPASGLYLDEVHYDPSPFDA